MWGKIKDWLEFDGGCLPSEPVEIARDLVAPKYGYAREQVIQLERKEDMKSRGLPSPDYGDALALTFARPVQPLRYAQAQQYARGTGNPVLGHNAKQQPQVVRGPGRAW
jgi:hypothetical protein